MPSQWNVQVGLPEIFSKKTTDKSNFYIGPRPKSPNKFGTIKSKNWHLFLIINYS